MADGVSLAEAHLRSSSDWGACHGSDMVHLRPGDVLHVTRIDRLARSMHDFARIAHDLKSRGIGLTVIQHGIDTTQGGPVGALTTLSAPAGSAARTRLRPTRPPRDNGLGASVGCKWTSASISA